MAAVEEWVWEIPDTATAALALVEFAGVITADRSLGEVLRDQMLLEERDAFYQTVAIANVVAWINKQDSSRRDFSRSSSAAISAFKVPSWSARSPTEWL